MTFHEFGEKGKPIILFTHGLNICWQMWLPEIALLEKDYFIIAPALDGHDEDDKKSRFISVSDEGEKIHRYITENYGSKIYIAVGMSMGGGITWEVIRRGINAEYIVFDSGVFSSMPSALIGVMGSMQTSIKNGTRDRTPKYLSNLEKVYGKKLAPHYIRMADFMTDENLLAATRSICTYVMPENIDIGDAKIIALRGTVFMEIMAKKSMKLLKKHYPNAYTKIFNGYAHGELSTNRPEEFIKEIFTAIEAVN